MPYEPLKRIADRQRLLTDLQDLTTILDARLVQLREHGLPDVAVATETLRNQMLGAIAEMELELPQVPRPTRQLPEST